MHNLTGSAAFWTNIGILLLCIEVIVFVHELGHFLIAKLSKVRVAEFAIGMGPTLFSWRRNGTTFSFKLLPFGGYVATLSKHTIQEIERIKQQNLTLEQKDFVEKKLYGLGIHEDFSWQKPIEDVSWVRRAWFSSMGVIFNFIAAFLMLAILYPSVGKAVPTGDGVLLAGGNVIRLKSMTFTQVNKENKYETKEGIVVTDYLEMRKLLKNPINHLEESADPGYTYMIIDQAPTKIDPVSGGRGDYEPFERTTYIRFKWEVLNKNNGEWEIRETRSNYFSNDPHLIPFEVRDMNGNFVKWELWNFNVGEYFVIYPFYYYVEGRMEYLMEYLPASTQPGTLGISYIFFHQEQELVRQTGINGFGESFVDTFKIFGDGWIFIGDIFSFGALSNAIDQPTAIITTINSQYWIYIIMDMLIVLSMVMIAFNILPIPPLDGWKIVESFYLGITKKEIPYEIQVKLSKIGWMFIIGFTIVAFLFILI